MKASYLNLFLFLLISTSLVSCHHRNGRSVPSDSRLIHLLNERLTNVIMQDGFTPPVASRIYAYSNIAGYEASIINNRNYHSLQTQLNGLASLPSPASPNQLDRRVVLIRSFTDVANSILYRDSILSNLADSLIDIIKEEEGMDNKVEASLVYANTLGKAIIDWSVTDGYGKTRKMSIYTPINKPNAWQPTPPKYTDAIEPYWGSLRPFVIDSTSQFATKLDIPFDTSSNSAFYKMCRELYDTSQHLDSTKIMIARFWDDNPLIILSKGHTMINFRQISPAGHWINITKIVALQKQLSLEQSSDVYMRVSLALADAFIACWDIKYSTNLLRPITYINQYIDPKWKPLIETPPFPEYTCGHSTISAAASNVLAGFFGDSVQFVDDTNDPYNLPVRKFDSFLGASEEAGMSRMYGGIHYHNSCIKGRTQGLDIGKLVMKKIITVQAPQ